MPNLHRFAAPVFLAATLTACMGVQGEVRLDLPVVLPLVTVEPGIQVVEDYDEEVFYVEGNYWHRRSDGWYRAGDPHGRWAHVEQREAPQAIVRTPPGHYKHYRQAKRPAQERHDEGRREGGEGRR